MVLPENNAILSCLGDKGGPMVEALAGVAAFDPAYRHLLK